MWLAVLATVALASPWDMTFDPERLRITAIEGGDQIRTAVLYSGPGMGEAASALCRIMSSEQIPCQVVEVKGRQAKMLNSERVASARPAAANLVYDITNAPGSRSSALVSTFDEVGSRIDWYIGNPGEPAHSSPLVQWLVGEIDTARRGGGKQPNLGREEAAAELLEQADELIEANAMVEARALIDRLVSEFEGTRAASMAIRQLRELRVIGNPELPLSMAHWFQGEDTIRQGRPTLYVFWEVWCPHCKREVPKLEQTFASFGPRGLQMIGVTKQSRGITDDQVESFIADNSLSYAVAREEGEVMSEHYGVLGIPAAAMVVDGVVVWRGHPGRLSDEMFESWLR